MRYFIAILIALASLMGFATPSHAATPTPAWRAFTTVTLPCSDASYEAEMACWTTEKGRTYVKFDDGDVKVRIAKPAHKPSKAHPLKVTLYFYADGDANMDAMRVTQDGRVLARNAAA